MSTEQTYKERILAVLVYIQRHLDEEMSLDELARCAHFSSFHFQRIFRALVGETVREHIRRLRLERAAGRLKLTGLPILNIALEAGYETHEAFTRAFGALFGCSPSEYRGAHQVATVAAAPSRVHYSDSGDLQDFTLPEFGGPPMDVRIEQLPTLRVVFARGVGPYQQAATQAWARLCAWAGQHGVYGPNTLFIGICHDDPEVTPADKIRYDAAMTVDTHVQPEGDIGVQDIPAGAHAVGTHHGPYETLSKSWGELYGRWLPQSGHRLRNAPSFEVYRNNPQTTPPDQLVTDLYVPIETAV